MTVMVYYPHLKVILKKMIQGTKVETLIVGPKSKYFQLRPCLKLTRITVNINVPRLEADIEETHDRI